MLSNWIVKSEKRLLNVHNNIASKLKSIKRVFISKGQMMKTFDYINSLHAKNDYRGIETMISMLHNNLPPIHSPRYHKYQQLIDYSIFLIEIKNIDNYNECNILAYDLIQSLNVGHELGCNIQNRVYELIR